MNRAAKIRQQDEYDCGAASLSSIASWYGVNVSLSRIRRACGCTGEGITIKGIIDGARELGLKGKAFKCADDKEKSLSYLETIHSPVIAHLHRKDGMFHFVVICGVSNSKVMVMDPGEGEYKNIRVPDFLSEWSGYVIFIVPGDNFEKRDERENKYLRLLRILKFHKTEILLALAGSVALTCIGICNSLFLQQIIDRAIPQRDTVSMMIIASVVVMLIPLSLYIGYARALYLIRNGIKIDTRLIISYIRKIFRLPAGFFEEYSSGDLSSRISDAFTIRTFISEGLVSLFVSVLTLVAVFVMMFTFYWRLALYTLIFIPLYAGLYFMSDHINRKYSKDIAVAGARFESDFIDGVEGAESIRHFGNQGLLAGRTEESYAALTEKTYCAGKAISLFGAAGDGISKLLLATIIVVGGFAVFKHQMSMGEMVSFYTLCAFFTAPMNALVNMNSIMNQALVSSERLFDIIDTEDEYNDHNTHKHIDLPNFFLDGKAADIELRGLCFGYAGRDALFENLNCTFRGGRITAICGESGCGKSTLGLLIMRDLIPAAGKIFIGRTGIVNGNMLDIRTLYLDQWRRYVSVSPQRCHLFSTTVLDNITSGEQNPDIERIALICHDLGMENFIRMLPEGLMTRIGDKGKTLSGGEMQKISIARALYRAPAVYIFDEATSFMDDESEKYVLEKMADLKRNGKSVIMITHKKSNLDIADDIIRL